jgi:uncharacterized protein
MKPLYITAAVTFSGKTALAMGVGLKLQEAGKKVGYFKPVSSQPYLVDGKLVDEDAEFVRRTLKLDTPLNELSPVVIDESLLTSIIEGRSARNFAQEVRDAYGRLGQDKDVLLVEGGGSMREGYAVGLPVVDLAEMLDLPTLGVVRYRDGLKLLDDVLALRARIGDRFLGVVINAVSVDAFDTVKNKVSSYLEKQGVKVYGVLPHQASLMAISVGELVGITNARVLTTNAHAEKLVENLSVGAMSVEAALPRFRRVLNKAVITGGDRADIQAAALETSTSALILTGNLQPSSTIIQRAEETGVPVLMVSGSTIDTIEAVEKVFGKTRLASPEKLAYFLRTIDTHLDTARLFADLGV